MKKAILSLAVLTLVGCDIKNDTASALSGISKVPRKLSRAVIGKDENNDTKQDIKLSELDERVELLEFANDMQFQLISLNASNIQGNSDSIDAVDSLVEVIQNDISNLELQIDSNFEELTEGLEDLNGDIESLQVFVTRNRNRLSRLNNRINRLNARDRRIVRRLQRTERAINRLRSVVNASQVEVLNPCGVQGQHDEILLKIGTTVISYFKASGSKEFLSILNPGTAYETTDGFSCNFTIDVNGDIL